MASRLLATLIISLALVSICTADTVPELYSKSYSQEYAGRYSQALEAMALIKSQSDDYVCELRIGWLLYLSKQYGESVEAYNSAINFAPEAVEPYLGLILPLTVQKKWRSIIVVVDSVLKNDPSNYSALSNKAWALYCLGRFSESAEIYSKIIRLYPADLDMQAGLGWALLKDGNIAKAKSIFEKVLTVSPANVSASDGIAACK